MNGVILEGELYSADGESERVRIFLGYDMDADEQPNVHARRSFGERGAILTLKVHDVERALKVLREEWMSEPGSVLERTES